jgi:hypothetical protein
MSKFTLRDAATAIAGLTEMQGNILQAIQQLAANGNHAAAPAPANLARLVPVSVVAPQGPPIVTRDERHRADVAASVQQQTSDANRLGNVNVEDVTIDDGNRQIPEDKTDREGPCWASNTLQTPNGLFPARKRKKNPRTGNLEIVNYDVSAANRAHFMAMASGRQFGLEVTLGVPDGKGGEKIARFPALCTLSAKQFQSYDHGLYGRIESIDIVLPDGSEYMLSGQVNMQLKKRKFS